MWRFRPQCLPGKSEYFHPIKQKRKNAVFIVSCLNFSVLSTDEL